MITTPPQVLFFDVNETLLDLQPVKDSVADALGGKRELVPLWFTTLLQYSLVATVGKHYADFGAIGAATLQMVARKNGMELTDAEAKAAIQPLRALSPYPEVAEALAQLRSSGYRLFTLTNSAPDALADQMKHAGLTDYFEELLSVESVKKFKPHWETYTWAANRVGRAPADCMLVAAHGWDVAGARWAGMRTTFVARPGQTTYPLAEAPELRVNDLQELAQHLPKAQARAAGS